jgi:hypothetical protein
MIKNTGLGIGDNTGDENAKKAAAYLAKEHLASQLTDKRTLAEVNLAREKLGLPPNSYPGFKTGGAAGSILNKIF